MSRLGYLVLAALALALNTPAAADDKAKAIVYREYGPPGVLHLEEIEKPAITENQVLIKVRAAAANPLDWHRVRGKPYVVRMDGGVFQPKEIRLGNDVAGVVEAVGAAVTRFKPGDEVFGVGMGGFGAYAKANQRRITLKPEAMSFEDAAALPVAAITALQALRDTGGIQPGQKVLINGASGGVGTFAIQIAKAMGAHVTGVCSTRNVELVKGLGADRVIDYTQQDFAKDAERYDVVMDNVGNRSLSDIREVLKPSGKHVMIGGGGPGDDPWIGPFATMAWAYITSPFVSQTFAFMLADVTTEELDVLKTMVAENKLRPVIDRMYPLAETPAAIAYIEEGRARGKVIVTVPQE